MFRHRVYHPSKKLGKGKIAEINPASNPREIIGNLGSDEIAVVRYGLIPFGFEEGPGFRAGKGADERASKFLRAGERIVILPRTSIDTLVSDSISPRRRRQQAYETADPNMAIAGYMWQAIQDNQVRVVSANNIMEGLQLYAFSELVGPDSKDSIKVHEYGVDPRNKKIGTKIIGEVPSRSKNLRHQIVMSHFPHIGSSEHEVWPMLRTEHGGACIGKVLGVSFPKTKQGDPRVLDEIFCCPHDVALYAAVSQKEKERVERLAKAQRKDPTKIRKLPLQPFALFTPETVDFWKKLRNQVVFGTKDRARPLLEAEIEVLLQNFLLNTDPQSTMYTSRSIRSYDWTPDIPLVA
jgi:hypothetical protein